MGTQETQRLLASALGGDAAHLGQLFERLRARTVLWCASRMSETLRAKIDAEDAAHEILAQALKDFHQFHGGNLSEFGGWYWTVAENRLRDLVDYYGAKKRQPGDPLTMSQTSPSQAAAKGELIVRLQRAIEALPEEHRAALRLVKLEQRTPEEVGEMLGKSANAIRILYCRAMKQLREILGQEGVGGIG
jgi:RNA polymerase sigma-70 factor (ECF subfamily)